MREDGAKARIIHFVKRTDLRLQNSALKLENRIQRGTRLIRFSLCGVAADNFHRSANLIDKLLGCGIEVLQTLCVNQEQESDTVKTDCAGLNLGLPRNRAVISLLQTASAVRVMLGTHVRLNRGKLPVQTLLRLIFAEGCKIDFGIHVRKGRHIRESLREHADFRHLGNRHRPHIIINPSVVNRQIGFADILSSVWHQTADSLRLTFLETRRILFYNFFFLHSYTSVLTMPS